MGINRNVDMTADQPMLLKIHAYIVLLEITHAMWPMLIMSDGDSELRLRDFF